MSNLIAWTLSRSHGIENRNKNYNSNVLKEPSTVSSETKKKKKRLHAYLLIPSPSYKLSSAANLQRGRKEKREKMLEKEKKKEEKKRKKLSRFPSTLAHGRYSYIAREARWLQKRLNYRGRKRVPSGLIRPRKMRAESDARRCRSVATDGGRARRGEREGGEKGAEGGWGRRWPRSRSDCERRGRGVVDRRGWHSP